MDPGSMADSLTDSLIVELSDPLADSAVLKQLALQCQTYSPIVGIEEAILPESLLLDITGCEIHFGGELGLAQQLWNELSADTYRTQMAVADSVGAAWAMAHFGVSARNPIQVVPPGRHIERLRSLPVAALRLSIKTLATLDKLDVRSIGQLERIPRATLPARFGKEPLLRLDQAWGTAHELIVPESIPASLNAVWNAEEAVANRELLEQVQRELLDQLLVKLLPQRMGIRELLCSCSGVVDSVDLTLRLIQPSVDRQHLWNLLRLEWERLERGFQTSRTLPPRCLNEGMTSIRLVIEHIAPLRVRQQTLFDLEPDRKQALAFRQFVERLSSRLGSQAVLSIRLVPDPQPESSWESFSSDSSATESKNKSVSRGDSKSGGLNRDEACVWDDATSRFIASTGYEWQCSLARSRPLRLLKSPELLRVFVATSHAPHCNAPPQRIGWGGRTLRVTRVWGPERIETGWWREDDVCRDYYRIEIDSGQHLWIFRCLRTNHWFLHGFYD